MDERLGALAAGLALAGILDVLLGLFWPENLVEGWRPDRATLFATGVIFTALGFGAAALVGGLT